MPRDFKTIEEVETRAQQHGFRAKLKSESDEDYRNAVADHVRHIDPVEAVEIRHGQGWDKQSPFSILAEAFSTPGVLRK